LWDTLELYFSGANVRNEIGAAISPAFGDSCFWAIVTFSGVVRETTRQSLPPPINAAFVRIARHCDPQEVRNHPFDIPVSVLLQKRRRPTHRNHFIRVNAAYRDGCTELFGVGRKRLGAGDFEERRFVIRL